MVSDKASLTDYMNSKAGPVAPQALPDIVLDQKR